jgi:hypothetical protein
MCQKDIWYQVTTFSELNRDSLCTRQTTDSFPCQLHSQIAEGHGYRSLDRAPQLEVVTTDVPVPYSLTLLSVYQQLN